MSKVEPLPSTNTEVYQPKKKEQNRVMDIFQSQVPEMVQKDTMSIILKDTEKSKDPG